MPENTEQQTPQSAINFDEFSLGDIEDFEEISGIPFEELSNDEEANMPMKALTALVFITKRQDDPDYTVAQARKIKLKELNEILGVGDDDPNAEEDAE